MRKSRVLAAGLGAQNMVIEDVEIETETVGRNKPGGTVTLIEMCSGAVGFRVVQDFTA